MCHSLRSSSTSGVLAAWVRTTRRWVGSAQIRARTALSFPGRPVSAAAGLSWSTTTACLPSTGCTKAILVPSGDMVTWSITGSLP